MEVGDVTVRSTFDGPLIKVKDLAIINDDFEDERVLSRMNGKAAISFIVYLSETGDVIRTTPILHAITNRYPDAEITWLTHYPVFVPKSIVHNILKWNQESVIWLQSREFDTLYNLDKDREAIGIAKILSAKVRKGYLPDKFGKCKPADVDAEQKWLTGIYDDVSKRNHLSYPEELFERQLDLISQELSLDEDFVRSLRTRLETFGRHVSLYKRRAGNISPEIIQNDILSNSPL